MLKRITPALVLAAIAIPAHASGDRYVFHVTVRNSDGVVLEERQAGTEAPTAAKPGYASVRNEREIPYIAGTKDGKTVTDKVSVGIKYGFSVMDSDAGVRFAMEAAFTNLMGFERVDDGLSSQRPLLETNGYETVALLDPVKREWSMDRDFSKEGVKVAVRVERIPQ